MGDLPLDQHHKIEGGKKKKKKKITGVGLKN